MWQKHITFYNKDGALGKFICENLGLSSKFGSDPHCEILLDIKGRQIRFIIMTRWDFGFNHYVEWELQTYQDLLTKRMKRKAAEIKKEIENKIDIIKEEFKIESYNNNSLERKCFYDITISREAYDNILVLLKIEGLEIQS